MMEVDAQINGLDQKSIEYTDHSMGGNFFVGNGIYSGNISTYFSNPIYVGLNIDYYRNRFVIQFDNYLGFGKTQNILDFTNQDFWDKNDFVLSGMINLSIGFSIIDNDKIMIVPLVGMGFNKLAANLDELYDFKNPFKPIAPHITLGGYIDLRSLKIFKYHPSFNSQDGSYTCPRLSFGYTLPIGQIDYAQFYQGNQLYLSLGIGGLGKLK